MKNVLLTVILLLACMGCARKKTIEGEAFYVTASGSAIKLAGIPVWVYDIEKSQRSFDRWGEAFTLSSKQTVDRISHETEAGQAELEAMKAEGLKFIEDKEEGYMEKANAILERMKARAAELGEQQKKDNIELKALSAVQKHPALLYGYWANQNEPVTKLQTNSLGGFSVVLDPDREYFILALVENSIEGIDGYPLWVEVVPRDSKRSKLILSNHNLRRGKNLLSVKSDGE